MNKESRVIRWHENFLRWAQKNKATGTEDYEATDYALKCIRVCSDLHFAAPNLFRVLRKNGIKFSKETEQCFTTLFQTE